MIPYLSTVISQYGNSPTLVQLVKNIDGYIAPDTNIDNFYNLMWNVDTATSYGLDCWGRIVGVGRVLQLSTEPFFGWGHGGTSSGLGWNQAIFFHGTNFTANYALLDGPFRNLILAKALANICDGTIGAINQILINLFGPDGPLPVPGGNSYCTDGEDMTMTYTFPSALTPVQEAIITQSGVLPKPAGVSVTVVT